MREAIGGTWLMGIVVFFIILFSGYLALSVNQARAFNAKNGIIEIIEKHNGHTEAACAEITDFFQRIGFYAGGNCDLGGRDRGVGQMNVASGPRYCVIEHLTQTPTHRQAYYTITVFFRVDLPIFRNIFVFPISGETTTIQFPGTMQACGALDFDW